MKAQSRDGETEERDAGSRRRFRFRRNEGDDQQARLDDIAAQVDALVASRGSSTGNAAAPAGQGLDMAGAVAARQQADDAERRRQDAASQAALDALAQLEGRMRAAQAASGATSEATTAAATATVNADATTNAAGDQAGTDAGAAEPGLAARFPEQHSTPSTARPEDHVSTTTHHDAPAAGSDTYAEPAVLRPTAGHPPQAQQDAELQRAPSQGRQPDQRDGVVSTATTSTSAGIRLGRELVDLNRIVRVVEEEAEEARYRIDAELRHAREEADVIVREASDDAERIREHAQQQARVLLGEVEEIISESQATGQQILQHADQEAGALRMQATETLVHAQEEARKIVETARREGEQVLAEQRRLATVRAQEALREQDRLKDQIRRLEERRRQVLESLEPLIDQLSQMIPAERNVVEFPGGPRS